VKIAENLSMHGQIFADAVDRKFSDKPLFLYHHNPLVSLRNPNLFLFNIRPEA